MTTLQQRVFQYLCSYFCVTSTVTVAAALTAYEESSKVCTDLPAIKKGIYQLNEIVKRGIKTRKHLDVLEAISKKNVPEFRVHSKHVCLNKFFDAAKAFDWEFDEDEFGRLHEALVESLKHPTLSKISEEFDKRLDICGDIFVVALCTAHVTLNLPSALCCMPLSSLNIVQLNAVGKMLFCWLKEDVLIDHSGGSNPLKRFSRTLRREIVGYAAQTKVIVDFFRSGWSILQEMVIELYRNVWKVPVTSHLEDAFLVGNHIPFIFFYLDFIKENVQEFPQVCVNKDLWMFRFQSRCFVCNSTHKRFTLLKYLDDTFGLCYRCVQGFHEGCPVVVEDCFQRLQELLCVCLGEPPRKPLRVLNPIFSSVLVSSRKKMFCPCPSIVACLIEFDSKVVKKSFNQIQINGIPHMNALMVPAEGVMELCEITMFSSVQAQILSQFNDKEQLLACILPIKCSHGISFNLTFTMVAAAPDPTREGKVNKNATKLAINNQCIKRHQKIVGDAFVFVEHNVNGVMPFQQVMFKNIVRFIAHDSVVLSPNFWNVSPGVENSW